MSTEPRANSLPGMHLMAAASAFTALMAALAKLAGELQVPVFEVVAARSTVLLALAVALLVSMQINPLDSQRLGLLFVRGVLGFASVSAMYSAVRLLPLADAAVLAFLSPVVVALLSPCLLHEPPSRGVVLALPLALVGVVLVVQPSALFGSGGGVALSAAGTIAALLQAVFSAGARISVRSLGSSEPMACIICSMALVSCFGSGLVGAFVPGQHFVVPPSAKAWACMLGTGLCGCGVQLLQTAALQRSRAAPAVAMSYVTVLWGLLFDLLLFRHVPTKLGILGAAFVCASSLVLLRFELAPPAPQQLQANEEGEDAAEVRPLLVELNGSGGKQGRRGSRPPVLPQV